MRKILCLILTILLCISNVNFIMANPAIEEENHFVKNAVSSSKVVNNGSEFVKYKGNIYYWKYNKNSFEKNAVWADYSPKYRVKNIMMCLQNNGKRVKKFEISGYGNIYIYNNRMYLQSAGTVSYEPKIFSVDMNGKNRKDFGTGVIKGIDTKNGRLIYELEGKIMSLNCKNGSKKILSSQGEFLELDNGVVYYYDDAGIRDLVRIKSIRADGTKNKQIVSVKLKLSDDDPREWLEIIQFQIYKNTLYFSYGTFCGTAHEYGGGEIAKVKKDGTGFKVLAGTEENPVDNKFYILKSQNDTKLIYNTISRTAQAISLKNYKVTTTKFTVQPMKEAFNDGDNVSIYFSDSGKKTTLVRKSDYSSLGNNLSLKNGYDETYVGIKPVEYIDGNVYFKVEVSRHNPKVDLGWRYGYTRKITKVYKKNLKTNKKVLLYSY